MASIYERKDKTYSYDPNEDYQKKMDEAAKAGDYAAAARYEQQRNEKIQGEGLTQYQTTNQYAKYLPQEKPTYTSPWQSQLNDILRQINGRKEFNYDINADALYQQYKDQYSKQGQLAMQDTMGKAAALTGGYGNSYAQTVGQQAYQDYLGRLNERVPELYQLALQKYQAEGDALYDRYALLQGAQDREYERYQGQLSEYYNGLDREEARKNEERDRAYSLALQMLQSGMMPSDGLLSGSGISAEDAQKIYGAYAAPSYGGGGGYYSTEKDGLPTKNWTALFQAYQEGAGKGDLSGYYSELANLGREYDISEFEDYMAKNVQGYESKYGGDVTTPVNIPEFGDIKRTVQYASPERFEEIMALYEDYLTQEQLDELAAIYANRGLG